MARTERSLSLRITLWVVLYMLLLSTVVIALGNSINEHAERMVWKSMLHSEIDHFDRRRADDPGYRWRDIEGASLYGAGSDRPMPPELAHLKPGARVVASGLQWAPPWMWPTNGFVLLAALYSVTSLEGLGRPWDKLAARLRGVQVDTTLMGGIYICSGVFAG